MKWGVHRALRKASSMARLQKRADKFSKKALKYEQRAESTHARKDMSMRANRYNRKAIKAEKRIAKIDKAIRNEQGSGNSRRLAKLNSQRQGYAYKASVNRRRSDNISKRTGYGSAALRLSDKSMKYAAKAEKQKLKMARNQHYIEKVRSNNRKLAVKNPQLASKYQKMLDRIGG